MISKYYASYILSRLNNGPRKVKHSYSLRKSNSIAVLFDTTEVKNIKLVKESVPFTV